ncbi:MAG TPA: hypothetical protein VGR28_08730 [Candidatus Thermoplasmatota archaeon]|jgi:hypothetical protein|nr:hypothetical protein [Candidatus Thermoplasmatota archaeon]
MAQAPSRWIAPTAVLLMLTVAPTALATCEGTDCASVLLGIGDQVVDFAADSISHPTQVWTDCPGFAFCSDADPVFGAPTSCPVNDVPLACPYSHERAFAADGIDYANRFPASATPDSPDQAVLVGQGHETVTLNGVTYDCSGPSLASLEAGRKPLGAEPGITFTIGGASAAWPSAASACLEGERVQPGYKDIADGSDYPDGAWSAVKTAGGHVWAVSLGAPSYDGTRSVSYVYSSPDGQQRATFEGALLEWR